jgi:hypothetical protein
LENLESKSNRKDHVKGVNRITPDMFGLQGRCKLMEVILELYATVFRSGVIRTRSTTAPGSGPKTRKNNPERRRRNRRAFREKVA